MRLHMQPDFPQEDLTSDNREIIGYTLRHDAGLFAQTETLQDNQRYVHYIADRALRHAGVTTRYDENEYNSFSQGFATFDVISDLVHPPRLYDGETAISNIRKLFTKADRLIDDELIGILADTPAITEDYVFGRDIDTPNGITTETLVLDTANRSRELSADPLAEVLQTSIIEQRSFLLNLYPNTHDLIVSFGIEHGETPAQLQLRIAGASLARVLQTAP